MRAIKKKTALFMAVLMILSTVLTNTGLTVAAADTTTVAAWSYSAAPEESEPPFYATSGDSTATLDLSGATYSTFSSKSLCANKWTEGAYWLMSLSTEGYEDLTFTASMRSSNTGPANFKLQYRTSTASDASWTDVTDGAVTTTNTLSVVYSALALPTEAEDCETLQLRVVMADTTSVNGGTVATNGTSNINSISISGTAISDSGDSGDSGSGDSGDSGDEPEEETIVTIAEAKTATESATVQGTVIYVSGKNVYVQDSTGGIDLYFSTADSTIEVGDVLKATGTPTTYNGLVELTGVTEYEVTGTAELPSQTVTVADILADYDTGDLESTRVYIENAELTSVGTYTSTLTQDGSSITIYNMPTLDGISAGDTISLYAVVSDYNGYQLLVASADDVTLVSAGGTGDDGDDDDTITGTYVDSISSGDQVVIYYPNGGLAITGTASGTKLTGISATIEDETLTTTTEALILTVLGNETDGYRFMTDDGQYLTSGSAGSSLTLSDTLTDYAYWLLEEADGGYYIKNVNAVYNSTYSQYIEYYYGFTTYSKTSSSSTAIYIYQFYKTGETEVKDYTVDTSLVFDIAQWGGNGPYDTTTNATTIYGDTYTTNDQVDTNATYSIVANGSNAQPYMTTTPSTGGTTYYMGGQNIGSGDDDYAQFTFSSMGYADMTMSFRMRVTNTSAGSWQLQYSTDGETFTNFTTGTYSYSYTAYTSDSESYSVSDEGDITDGVLAMSMAPTYYITFEFDVPDGAEDEEIVYIRLVPGTTRASGASGTIGGNIRLDSVVISGSPIVSDDITGIVTVDPEAGEVPAGTEITMSSSTDGAVIHYSLDQGETWEVYDSENKPVLNEEDLPAVLTVYASADGISDSVTVNYSYTQAQVSTVKATPNGGTVSLGTKVTLRCATEDATILYSDNGGTTWNTYSSESRISLSALPVTLLVKAVKDGYIDSVQTTLSFTERENENYNIYFGQIHSHTSYSDGAGTCEEAFTYATDVDNLDFLAVTDHSNSFDNATSATISDGSVSEEWVEGNELAETYTTDTFVSLFGYEMTWSNGLGHINTFNTGGFQSRTQSDYTTYSTALQNYYTTLKTETSSISQFNHPGTTFGDFSDFAYYDEDIDNLITLIEVGNGEGTIGSSGYFPSYEYYTRALDKGWHVAPSNNQDNHKGKWGDANTARTVVLADSLTEENIYDAMRNYRVYATEDNDLSITYTLDDYIMGTILEEDAVGDTVTIEVELSDPTDDSIGEVEVIVNGGLSLASQTVDSSEETVTFEVSSSYSYYYIQVTEADGDIAVTAPVWVGDVEAVGISDISTDESVPVKDEELDITLDLYNNESTDFEITSIEFTIDDEVIHTVDVEGTGITSISAKGTASYTFGYTYDGVGSVNIYATVTGTLDGVEKVYQDVLQLTYVSSNMVTNVVVDGSHYNDYVTGYYGGNISDLTSIAADESIKVNIVEDVNDYYGEDNVLDSCALLIISAPAKYDGTATAGDYYATLFEDEFIDAVAEYVQAGGSVIVCGIADYQEKYADSADYHTAAQMNKLLAAIGSSMTLNDDEVYDAENNGGQYYRLYPENFNTESEWLSGVVTSDDVEDGDDYQTYSQYSGCSVDVGNGEWLVKGFDTTYSVDSDKDGVGATSEVETDDSYGYNIVVPEGEVVFLACEDSGYGGTIFAAGGVFCSDFEVDYEVDNIWDLPYANTTIIKNILSSVKVELPVSTIAEMRAGEMGEIYRIQGYVTAGTTNEDTTFFDAIYVQDETGGTTVFPFSEEGIEIGTKIDIIGYVDEYQGDKEIQVMSYTILDEESYVWEPEAVSAAEAMDYDTNGGKLLQVEGVVVEAEYSTDGTGVTQFVVEDENGDLAKVFIDGYILSGTTGENTLASIVKEGNTVSAVGLLYMHPEGDSEESVAVLRVRDCDEVVLISEAELGNCVMAQITTPSDNTFKMRLVGTVDGLDYDDVGFLVTWYNEDGSLHRDEVTHKLTKVYTGVYANGVLVEPDEGSYFFTYTYSEIPADETYYIKVANYTNDGTNIKVSSTYKYYELNNGTISVTDEDSIG